MMSVFNHIPTYELQVDGISQQTVNVSNVSVSILAARAERKYIFIQNLSTAAALVYIHFDASVATTTNGVGLREGEIYTFPDGLVYTGEIRAISDTAANKPDLPRGMVLMGVVNDDRTTVYVGGNKLKRGKVFVGQATSNASGVARLYLTDDGTATGNSIFNNVYSWSADVTAGVQVNSRTSTIGSNFVDVTVTNLQFTGVVLLGINILGAVTVTAVVGATVQFIVIGD